MSGKDVTMNGRQLQLQNGKCITKCCGPTTNSMRKNVAANVEAFRKNCCFNKFTTEVESAFPRFSRCVEGAKVADRTQTALDECSRRHRFALNSISHFSISARFQGQHNFEKNSRGNPPPDTPSFHSENVPFKRQHGFHFVRKCTYLCGQ